MEFNILKKRFVIARKADDFLDKVPERSDMLRHLYYHGAWVSHQDKRLEREWSSAFQLVNGVSVPILNFGNADDRGKILIPGVKKSHLFHCKKKFKIKAFQAVVEEYFPGNDPVVEIHLPI